MIKKRQPCAAAWAQHLIILIHTSCNPLNLSSSSLCNSRKVLSNRESSNVGAFTFNNFPGLRLVLSLQRTMSNAKYNMHHTQCYQNVAIALSISGPTDLSSAGFRGLRARYLLTIRNSNSGSCFGLLPSVLRLSAHSTNRPHLCLCIVIAYNERRSGNTLMATVYP